MLTQSVKRRRATAVHAELGQRDESPKDRVHVPIHEPMAPLRDEDPRPHGRRARRMSQVLLKTRDGGLVEWDQPRLLKLGFSNQKTATAEVGDLQGQRL